MPGPLSSSLDLTPAFLFPVTYGMEYLSLVLHLPGALCEGVSTEDQYETLHARRLQSYSAIHRLSMRVTTGAKYPLDIRLPTRQFITRGAGRSYGQHSRRASHAAASCSSASPCEGGRSLGIAGFLDLRSVP